MFWHREKQLEQSESRLSAQRGELAAVREGHQKGEVERQVLEGERAQLSEALARVRNQKNTYDQTQFALILLPDIQSLFVIVLPGGEQKRRTLSAAEQAAV